ncbi:hypothetical protein [Streptomyces sp. NPDC000931]|uniref:hypothetical protein n=1 Tax=Streptomyces sp. NPDC000931 TaxID=3154372 RepID=UPI0033337BCE
MFVLLAFAALLAAPVWVVAVVVKLLSAVLPGRRSDWGVRLLHWGAGMAAAAAVMLLVMVLGAVQLSDHESRSGTNSSPAPACRDAAPHLVEHLVGHRASYLPPAFDCVLEDGTTYPSSESYVWLNGLVVTCAAVSALLVAGGRYTTARQTARQTRVPGPETPG